MREDVADARGVIAMLSPDELRALVAEGVAQGVVAALARLQSKATDDEELTTKDAAKLLGISPAALRHHVSRGHITPDSPARKSGRKSNRFKRSTIEAFKSEGWKHDD